MESFIILELIKLFPNKSKYKDFDWVVREVIRRKAIDFTSNFVNNNSNLVFENFYSSNKDMIENLDNICIENSLKNFEKSSKAKSIIEFLEFVREKINKENFKDFVDWDREFVDMVLELYENKCEISKVDLVECMGYNLNESNKFNSKLNSFRLKCKNIFGEEMNV